MIQRNDLLGAFFCLEIDKGFQGIQKREAVILSFAYLLITLKKFFELLKE